MQDSPRLSEDMSCLSNADMQTHRANDGKDPTYVTARTRPTRRQGPDLRDGKDPASLTAS